MPSSRHHLNVLDCLTDSSLTENFLLLLQRCRNEKNLACAKHVYAHICKNGLEASEIVGNYVIPMFVECGSISDAQFSFKNLIYPNEHSWTSLILRYVEYGQYQQSLRIHQKMQEDNVNSSSYTFMALLKACIRLKDMERGRKIHSLIKEKGFKGDLFVGSALIDMYVRGGSLREVREVFDEMPVRNVVVWTALISGYVEHTSSLEALRCFEEMQWEGTTPTAATFICCLKACIDLRTINKGREIHAQIAQGKCDKDIFVGSTLVDMYIKCGSILEAEKVFVQLPAQNVVSWTALIAGYVDHGNGQGAYKCSQQMQMDGVSPNAITFAWILKACTAIGSIGKGREVHTQIIQQGFDRDLFIGNALLDMYAKCGSLAEAQNVFDRMVIRDAVSWNSLISGFAENGLGQEALNLVAKMKLGGMSPNATTFSSMLKVCAGIGCIDRGQEIHLQIAEMGFENDEFVGSSLVDMYAKCGLLCEARKVFNKLPIRNVVSWTALIAGYADCGSGEEALNCFSQMQFEGVRPNAITFLCMLKVCGRTGAIDKGRKIHKEIMRGGIETEICIFNSLIDMYAKCGSLIEARKVFDNLSAQDVVSWNVLIAGYGSNGFNHEALACFVTMNSEGIFPDATTFICSLKACCNIGAIGMGRKIHTDVVIKGFEQDPFIGSTLIDMYMKCRLLVEAQDVFDRLPARNVVCWTTLIAGLGDHGFFQEALRCYDVMHCEGVFPDAFTFVCSLRACGHIGAVEKGRELHIEICRSGVEKEIFIGNALIDMYSKCGSLVEACGVFDALPAHDIVTWNAMITAYGMNHEGNKAVQCFQIMCDQGLMPIDITFTCILTACSRAGLTFKGLECFNMMEEKYGILANIDHYTCMVDLLSRSGQLYEAEKLLQTAPCFMSKEMWIVLLSACKTYNEPEVGQRCFEQLVSMIPDHSAGYLLMANIYSSIGRWDDVNETEGLRNHLGAMKEPTNSFLRVNCKRHEDMRTSDTLEANMGIAPLELDLPPIFVKEKEWLEGPLHCSTPCYVEAQ